jgi:hypothetical protein
MKKTNVILAGAAALVTFAFGANAQVETYFNLQSYGTVAAGATITDETGNTQATLNTDPNTSLTSGGLAIASAWGNSASTGLTFASGSLSSFTGNFTIQDWVTVANPNNGVVLWGANNGPANTYIGDGYTGVTTLIGFTWGSLSGGGGTGNPLGQPYNRYGNTIPGGSLASGASYDLVLTYNASTYMFNQYVNGVWTGSLQEALGITSLAGAQSFAIGGCPNEPWSPWGDASANETTSAFLLYGNELTASQVAAEDALGAGAPVTAVEAAAVPEPSTCAMFITGLGFLAARRRVRV